MTSLVIAIDGPSGAGKSTVAALVAERLGLRTLDTGAMYRAVAWLAMREGIGIEDGSALAKLAEENPVAFSEGGVQIAGQDVSALIRTLEVGQAASRASTHPALRRALVAQQRTVVSQGRWILEGRDTTTVVVPDANVKVFLTASIEERARRRWLQLRDEMPGHRLQEVVRDVVERDHRDYTRDDSPLELAEDAVIVETFGVSPQAVAEKIASLSAG
ncbi:MAG: (d)CMP kinase [Fimbriimonadaceae bacterium]